MRKLTALIAALAMLLVAGCNTVQGLGKDIEKGGEALVTGVREAYERWRRLEERRERLLTGCQGLLRGRPAVLAAPQREVTGQRAQVRGVGVLLARDDASEPFDRALEVEGLAAVADRHAHLLEVRLGLFSPEMVAPSCTLPELVLVQRRGPDPKVQQSTIAVRSTLEFCFLLLTFLAPFLPPPSSPVFNSAIFLYL